MRVSAGRCDGYAPLRSYAAIGDGRTVALVADDGAVDWLALPDLDSPTVFAAVLDADRGGCCVLAPTEPFRACRRYLAGTNVLETTFVSASGEVQVTDAMSLSGEGLGPVRELQRRITPVRGRVPMRWSIRPRFDYGERRTRWSDRLRVPVAAAGGDALAVRAFGTGRGDVQDGILSGEFVTDPASPALLALCAAHQEPLVLPARQELDDRFATTVATWRSWVTDRHTGGPWQTAVERSALALRLLMYAPSGAVAAAATTSLPEEVGGQRNWDYRYCWVRDAAFTLDALLRLGCAPEARAYFWWLLHATALTHPRLHPLYRLDGGTPARERVLPLAGYRGSRPVRSGNAAAGQLQLDTYGELLDSVWLYAVRYGRLDPDTGRRVAETADLVCRLWTEPDAGIWEVRSAPAHFTHSKMMCWVALDRALRLSEDGHVPGRHAGWWRREAHRIAEFVEQRCFSAASGCYARSADSTELDAGVLLGLLAGYGDRHGSRWQHTVDVIRRELGHGPFLLRYAGADGLTGQEGAFLPCSFWLAAALARTGRIPQAAALLDELVELSNDVGLYAEEVDPSTGDFLGNIPQALSHLALINAATTIAEERGAER